MIKQKLQQKAGKMLQKIIKKKGMRKLKFFCQMCERQCDDQHGFNLHCKSEDHVQQMKVFLGNQKNITDDYSNQLETNFLELLKQKYSNKLMKANNIYKEYVSDKFHLHMSATRWGSLNGFCRYLEDMGKCLVEWTEKGPYIQYIDKSPEAIMRQAEKEKRELLKQEQIQKNRNYIEKQMKKANDILKNKQQQAVQNNYQQKQEEKQEQLININPIKFQLQTSEPIKEKNSVFNTSSIQKNHSQETQNIQIINKKSMVQILADKFSKNEEEEQIRKKVHNQEPIVPQLKQLNQEKGWLEQGLIIKIKDKSILNGQLYKEKGLVQSLHSEFIGNIKPLNKKFAEYLLQIDQSLLETVIPKVSGIVMILQRGEDFKQLGIVNNILLEQQIAQVQMQHKNNDIKEFHFNEICKVSIQEED